MSNICEGYVTAKKRAEDRCLWCVSVTRVIDLLLQQNTRRRRRRSVTKLTVELMSNYSKNGPLLHFQRTPTILNQYQQILVQRIASYSALNRNCYFLINVKNRVPAEVFLWHPQQRQLHGNTLMKRRQSRNFKSLNITTSTKFETVD